MGVNTDFIVCYVRYKYEKCISHHAMDKFYSLRTKFEFLFTMIYCCGCNNHFFVALSPHPAIAMSYCQYTRSTEYYRFIFLILLIVIPGTKPAFLCEGDERSLHHMKGHRRMAGSGALDLNFRLIASCMWPCTSISRKVPYVQY